KMEEMKEVLNRLDTTIAALTTQMVGLKDDVRKIGNRVNILETDFVKRNPVADIPLPLTRPRTEYELKESSAVPDCVKELLTFEDDSEKYLSWINRAQTIINDYEVIREKPLYRSVLIQIRQKIRGNADMALNAYNVRDDDWTEVKRVLTLHFADKRDALIDRKNDLLTISPGIKIPLLSKKSLNIHLLLDTTHPESAKETLTALIGEYSKIFEPLSPGEAVDTSVRAEIRTSTSDPIYTKSYPYPTNMRGEVD
ncbi:hypothetical protein KR084_010629, partial [Drosophila pseudotakahashii]